MIEETFKRKPGRPKMIKPTLETELQKAESQIDRISNELHKQPLTVSQPERLEDAPIQVSKKDASKSGVLYLKPERSVNAPQKFNERWRKEYEESEELVEFIARHKESPGSAIQTWTRKFGGKPALFWTVPTDRVVCGPRVLAEQIRGCKHHIVTMDEHTVTSSDGMGTYHGAIQMKKEVARLEAEPVSTTTSIFMTKQVR